MRDTILLSIHPSHVEKILKGKKRFELRRKIPLNIKRVVIYATAPESRVVAIANVEEIISDQPSSLWLKVCGASGIDFKFFNNYFEKRNIAYAMRLGRLNLIERKIPLSHPQLKIQPPQSFRYLNEKQIAWLLDCAAPIVSNGTKKIFIGGVHGSGKSYLSKKIISAYGYHCVSASTLIKDGQGMLSLDKTVFDIDDNQRCLLSGLKTMQQLYSHVAIDGHFCLINANGTIDEIPIETFESINPELIIFANPPTKVIQKRLNERSNKIKLQSSIAEFKKRELSYAKKVANILSVPLEIVDTSRNDIFLHNRVEQIFCLDKE
jgi:predicted transcriptional regulator/adenylate kinase